MEYKHLFTLHNEVPHESYSGWIEFLQLRCDIRGVDGADIPTNKDDALQKDYDKTVFFGATNCNYIIFPNGHLHQNFGYHGDVLMKSIKQQGYETIQKELIESYEKIKAYLY